MITVSAFSMDYATRQCYPAQYKIGGIIPAGLVNNVRTIPNYEPSYRQRQSAQDEMLPLIVNEISWLTDSIVIGDNLTSEEKDIIKDKITILKESATDNMLTVVNIFKNNINDLDEYVNEFTEVTAANNEDANTFKNQFVLQMNAILNSLETLDSPFECRVFKHNTKHIIVCAFNIFENAKYRPLSLGYVMMPLLFEDFNAKLSTEESAFLRELRHQLILRRISMAPLTTELNAVVNSTKTTEFFKDKIILRTLTNIVENRISQLRNDLLSTQSDAAQALQHYYEQLHKFTELSDELAVKQEHEAEAIEEYKTALIQPWIKNIRVSGNDLIFDIFSYMDFYDTDLLECYIRGREHTDNEQVRDFVTFLKEVFIKGKYKLKAHATFKYNLTGQRTSMLSNNSLYLDGTLCNPHLYYYSCLGSYSSMLTKAMARNDLVTFVNLALASTRSINFSDGAVIGRWFDDQFSYGLNSERLFIECEDGTMISPKEVVDRARIPETVETTETTETTEVVLTNGTGTIGTVDIDTTNALYDEEAEFVW